MFYVVGILAYSYYIIINNNHNISVQFWDTLNTYWYKHFLFNCGPICLCNNLLLMAILCYVDVICLSLSLFFFFPKINIILKKYNLRTNKYWYPLNNNK